ncbi:MAG: hypothetical protein U0610_10440 [bacterium]
MRLVGQQLEEDVEELAADHHVEPAAGLVEDQQLGAGAERQQEPEPSLHSGGECGDLGIER